MKTFNFALATAFVLLILLSCVSYKSLAQNKTLVADETELVSLKSSYKVLTSNEAVFKLICGAFKSEGFKYTVSYKKDRQGLYIEYSIPFKSTDKQRLDEFFKTINK